MSVQEMIQNGTFDIWDNLSGFINGFINRNYPLSQDDLRAIINDETTPNIEARNSAFNIMQQTLSNIIEREGVKNEEWLKNLQENPLNTPVQSFADFERKIADLKQELLKAHWEATQAKQQDKIEKQSGRVNFIGDGEGWGYELDEPTNRNETQPGNSKTTNSPLQRQFFRPNLKRGNRSLFEGANPTGRKNRGSSYGETGTPTVDSDSAPTVDSDTAPTTPKQPPSLASGSKPRVLNDNRPPVYGESLSGPPHGIPSAPPEVGGDRGLKSGSKPRVLNDNRPPVYGESSSGPPHGIPSASPEVGDRGLKSGSKPNVRGVESTPGGAALNSSHSSPIEHHSFKSGLENTSDIDYSNGANQSNNNMNINQIEPSQESSIEEHSFGLKHGEKPSIYEGSASGRDNAANVDNANDIQEIEGDFANSFGGAHGQTNPTPPEGPDGPFTDSQKEPYTSKQAIADLVQKGINEGVGITDLNNCVNQIKTHMQNATLKKQREI